MRSNCSVKKWLIISTTVVLTGLFVLSGVDACSKEYSVHDNPYGNADPKTGKPYYGELKYQSSAHSFKFKQKINYRWAVQLADEVSKNQLPGKLPYRITDFKRTVKDAVLGVKNCNKTVFNFKLARLKDIRQETHAEYIKEYERFHAINLKYFEHEAAIRSALPPSKASDVTLNAIISKLGLTGARAMGTAGVLVNHTIKGTAVTAESLKCNPAVSVISLLPSLFNLAKQTWNVGSILSHKGRALEMLELKMYYQLGVLPQYKAKIKIMDETIEKLTKIFDENACKKSACEAGDSINTDSFTPSALPPQSQGHPPIEPIPMDKQPHMSGVSQPLPN